MAELLETGLVLMATGMGTVFTLLVVLVWLVSGLSKLCRWLDPPTPQPAPRPAGPPQPSPPPAADDEIVTVIGAAVSAFRRDGQR